MSKSAVALRTEERRSSLPQEIARAILDGFDRHYRLFRDAAIEARQLFERAAWPAMRSLARERIQMYDLRVEEAVRGLNAGDIKRRAVSHAKTRILGAQHFLLQNTAGGAGFTTCPGTTGPAQGSWPAARARHPSGDGYERPSLRQFDQRHVVGNPRPKRQLRPGPAAGRPGRLG